jgi:ferric-dicitrate binding protein FerR (iron transport regulator)
MNPPEHKSPEEQFEDAWKKWAQLPPRQSPAEAASRVRSMIEQRRRQRQPPWLFAAAAAVLVAAIALTVHWVRLSPQTVPSQPAAVLQETPQLGEGQVLMWIDDDTPLYMTFQPPEGQQARGGRL